MIGFLSAILLVVFYFFLGFVVFFLPLPDFLMLATMSARDVKRVYKTPLWFSHFQEFSVKFLGCPPICHLTQPGL